MFSRSGLLWKSRKQFLFYVLKNENRKWKTNGYKTSFIFLLENRFFLEIKNKKFLFGAFIFLATNLSLTQDVSNSTLSVKP